MQPKQRHAVYWQWADCQLHNRCVEAVTANGLQLDIQARMSRQGVVQLFIGIYSKSGSMLIEEYYPGGIEDTLNRALKWGEQRARALSAPIAPFERLPRRCH